MKCGPDKLGEKNRFYLAMFEGTLVLVAARQGKVAVVTITVANCNTTTRHK